MKLQRFIHTRTRKTLDLPVLGHGFVFSPVPSMKPSIWTLEGLKALGFMMTSNTPRWLPPIAYQRKGAQLNGRSRRRYSAY